MTNTSDSMQDERMAAAAERRLFRSTRQKVVAGVCGGLGEYFSVDPVWFRIGFVLLAIGGGSGLLIYLLMWLIVQPEPKDQTSSTTPRGQVTGIAVIGIVLVLVGAIALVDSVAPWMGHYFWPIIFVVGGLALVMGGVNRDHD